MSGNKLIILLWGVVPTISSVNIKHRKEGSSIELLTIMYDFRYLVWLGGKVAFKC